MSTYLKDINRPPDDYSNCPEHLTRYLDHLKNSAGLRPLTLTETMMVLREYLQYIGYTKELHLFPMRWDDHKDMNVEAISLSLVASVTSQEIMDYLRFLNTISDNCTGTINKKLSILRKYYAYLSQRADELGITFPQGVPTAGIKIQWPKTSKEPSLSLSAVKTLLSSLPCTYIGLRDKLAILLLVTTGISLSELIALNRDDLNDSWLLLTDHRGFSRYVFITEPVKKVARHYIAMCRDAEPFDPLFLSKPNCLKRISPKGLRDSLIRAGTEAGLTTTVSPNALKTTAADIMGQYAGKFGKPHIRAYMGQIGNDFNPNDDSPERDLFMQQVILSSPLGALE